MDAFAIKDEQGSLVCVEIDASEEETWESFIKSVEGRVPTIGSIIADIEYWKSLNHRCVPVQVTEIEPKAPK